MINVVNDIIFFWTKSFPLGQLWMISKEDKNDEKRNWSTDARALFAK